METNQGLAALRAMNVGERRGWTARIKDWERVRGSGSDLTARG